MTGVVEADAGRALYDEHQDKIRGFLMFNVQDQLREVYEAFPDVEEALSPDHYNTDDPVLRVDCSELGDYFDPDMVSRIHDNPAAFKHSLRLYMRENGTLIPPDDEGDYETYEDHPIDYNDITVRLVQFGERFSVGEYRADDLNRMVTIRGQVDKVTPVEPIIKKAHFRCECGGDSTTVYQPLHTGEEPTNECNVCGRKTMWELDMESKSTELQDYQMLRIREPPEKAQDGQGATLPVYCLDDLTGRVTAGDRVDITVRLRAPDADFDGTPNVSFYGVAKGIHRHDSSYQDIEIDRYKRVFKKHANADDVYQRLIDSIAPTVTPRDTDCEGYSKIESIKLAVALQLFSGGRKETPSGEGIRSDIHIGLIGDPATGKTRILEAAREISPRSTKTSGKNATAAAVTAAAVKDDFGESQWSLEAGAIVEAHGGLMTMDEIDKTPDKVISSLHDALESQRLPVSKADINATLHCETSVLAAGNPVETRFIDEMDKFEQIDIDPALYSRFDLIFTIEDSNDEDHIEHISDHKIDVWEAATRNSRGELDSDDTVIDPVVDLEVLRAWVAYARQEVQPVIKDDAVRSEIMEYHTKLKKQSSEYAPITHRKLDALIRLCEASARARLSDTVEIKDLRIAKSLIGSHIGDIALHDGEPVNITEYDAVSKSQREKQNQILATVQSEGPIELDDLLAEVDMPEAELKSRLKKHMRSGDVYKPEHGVYDAA